MNDEIETEASVTISGGRSGDEPCVRIKVEDSPSGAFVEVEISAKEFGQAVTGLGCRPAVARWRVSNVGKVRQHKTEHGVTSDNLHEFEVDGWRARGGDIGNNNRLDRKDGTYSVVFFRHVEPNDVEEQTDE